MYASARTRETGKEKSARGWERDTIKRVECVGSPPISAYLAMRVSQIYIHPRYIILADQLPGTRTFINVDAKLASILHGQIADEVERGDNFLFNNPTAIQQRYHDWRKLGRSLVRRWRAQPARRRDTLVEARIKKERSSRQSQYDPMEIAPLHSPNPSASIRTNTRLSNYATCCTSRFKGISRLDDYFND